MNRLILGGCFPTWEKSPQYTSQLKAVMDEVAALKEKRSFIQEQRKTNNQTVQRITYAATAMEEASAEITEWNEGLIRQLVDTVRVISAEKIIVFLHGGGQIEQNMV